MVSVFVMAQPDPPTSSNTENGTDPEGPRPPKMIHLEELESMVTDLIKKSLKEAGLRARANPLAGGKKLSPP